MQFLSRCFLLRAPSEAFYWTSAVLRSTTSNFISTFKLIGSCFLGIFGCWTFYRIAPLLYYNIGKDRNATAEKRRIRSRSDNSTLQHVGIISLTLMEIFCIRFIFLGWAKMHLTNDIPTHRLYGQFDTIFWHRIQYYCRYPSNPGSGTFYGLFTTKHNFLFWKILLVEKRDKIMYIKA